MLHAVKEQQLLIANVYCLEVIHIYLAWPGSGSEATADFLQLIF